MTGAVLADLIARTDQGPFVLLGHSLGARVMVSAAQALGTLPEPRIDSMHLLGAAVGRGADWRTLDKAVAGGVWNYHSSRDQVLRLLYRLRGAWGARRRRGRLQNEVSVNQGPRRHPFRRLALRLHRGGQAAAVVRKDGPDGMRVTFVRRIGAGGYRVTSDADRSSRAPRDAPHCWSRVTPHCFPPGLTIRPAEQWQPLDRDEYRRTHRHPQRLLLRGRH